MNDEENLSPAAQEELKKLTPTINSVEDWNSAYYGLLKGLANRDTSDVTEWEVKGQGIEVLEESREKHRVAVELKAFAEAFVGTEISDAIARLPTSTSLDELLQRLMPGQSDKDCRKKFDEFLKDWSQRHAKELMEINPRKISRSKYAAVLAKARLENLKAVSLPRLVQYDLRKEFDLWNKGCRDVHPLAATNAARSDKKAEKMERMLGLLPKSNRANETMTLDEWREKAKEIWDIPKSTFDKYRKELKLRYIEKPKWKFRVAAEKPPENK